MNLNALATGLTGLVQPAIAAIVQGSTGYTTAADGSQVPTYAPAQQTQVQVQALTQADIRHIEGMNIQGQTASVYMPGNWNGIIRTQGGGDLLTFNGATWRVIAVPEQWPDWTRVIVCRQP